ncbi:MAG: polymerase subunit sigma-24 [Acidimicrobiia bacterium]|nr:polymerase subunit sigma-24 [Acidimicrobiia bacterium]
MTEPLETIHRREWAIVVASLARSFGDLDLAEDCAAEAFARAVERWPEAGVPPNPGAWLITVARNLALDRLRRESKRSDRQQAAQRALDQRAEVEMVMGPVADDRLRLLFTCCHPALAADAQIALTLRLIGGLSTAEVARAFWTPEAAMVQRIGRAKRKIAAAGIPYRVPAAEDLPERLAGVLRVVYLIFREGYTPSSGERLVRTETCDEAIRLARLVVELLPEEPDAMGLLALLLLQNSRRDARADGDGRLVLLADQDRTRWDTAAIEEGSALASAALGRRRSIYPLQAAIAACHSEAVTDWPAVALLYGELARLDPSPAVVLNRAVAVAEVDGPAAALAMVDSLLSSEAGEAMARASHQPHVARADFLRRLGRLDEAVAAYERAVVMAPTEPERQYLSQRAAELRR